VGRFMVQDLLGHVSKPLGRHGGYGSVLFSSAAIVAAWGYFLYEGVQDPLGGINSLWPLFGIANQLLAAVAFVLATTILLKMGKLRWIWTTLVPMAALIAVTMTASWQKIFSPDPRLGFLAAANQMAAQIASGAVAPQRVAEVSRLIFNQRLDAAVTAVLAVMILALVADALLEWTRILTRAKQPTLHESPYVATQWAGGD
jgi:carbon starvation protein